eukprot:COSAG01_NODE_1996_length_8691_cov_10.109055_8_plen_130_part_00
MLPLVMVRDDMLMTGDTSFAAKHFDQLVGNALGAAGSPWPVDPANGLINTSDVLIDWPSGMRDRYVLTPFNSVANAFGVYGLETLGAHYPLVLAHGNANTCTGSATTQSSLRPDCRCGSGDCRLPRPNR